MNNTDFESTKTVSQTKNCFYICGLTGGPFFPIRAVQNHIQSRIPESSSILIGVRDSYESKVASEQNLDIEFLPKAKLDLLSFKNPNVVEIIQGFAKLIISLVFLSYSFAKSIFLVLKYKPILIYSTGSFLAVPMLWATKVLQVLKLAKTTIVIHQQDATIGLANKLTANLADLKSCVFQCTRDNYGQFAKAELIPNPILTQNYNSNNAWQDQQLESFVKSQDSNKPLLLIFGGGSGAKSINDWVEQNIKQLTAKYRVIHLTGILQKKEIEINNYKSKLPLAKGLALQVTGVIEVEKTQYYELNYHAQPAVLQDMPTLLASVDLVICRAGLGSISELSYLNKPTFLVPIPNTHQVQNARLISRSNSNFKILDQGRQEDWLQIITNTKFETYKNQFDQVALGQYYTQISTNLQNI